MRDSSFISTRTAVSALLVLVVVTSMIPATASAQSNETALCPYGPPAGQEQPDPGGDLEIAFVTDNSGSMDAETDSGETRIQVLKDALVSFVHNSDETDEFANVEIDGNLLTELTDDHDRVISDIEGVETDASVQDEGAAISTATEELVNGTNATENGTKVMVFVTDGEPVEEQAGLDAAQDARDKGITIYTIGIGDQIDDQFMIDVAGDESRYYESPNASDLDSIYTEISGAVEEEQAKRLNIQTRSLFKPGETYPYTISTEGLNENEDVTAEANLTSSNVSILSVDEANHQLSATNDPETSTWVRLDATHDNLTGCTNVVVSQPTVENLQILPTLWRFSAVVMDGFMFALLIGALLSVPAARFAGAFAGISVLEMVIVIGWFGGYVSFAFAAVSVFVAMFIGLNLAANIDYSVRR